MIKGTFKMDSEQRAKKCKDEITRWRWQEGFEPGGTDTTFEKIIQRHIDEAVQADKKGLVAACDLLTKTAIGCWDGQQDAYFVGKEELEMLRDELKRHTSEENNSG